MVSILVALAMGSRIGFGSLRQTQASAPPPSIADKTKGLDYRAGLIGSYIDARQGRAYLKLSAPDPVTGEVAQILYVESLVTGLGSNDLGIDRTQFGRTYVLDIKEIGGKVLFQVPNLSYRADSADAEERHANSQNFATSIIWAGPIAAADKDGSSLVDITDFLVSDAHDVAGSLDRSSGGSYRLDSNRSVLLPEQCKAFPENLEFEALLTYQSGKPGAIIGDHAPDSHSITLTQRHSFVRLPDDGYKPRKFDPRCGCFSIDYVDYAAPLGQPLVKQWIQRHRLEKIDPTAARSKVKKPIVYYVDRGVPEPIKTALITGGNYWAKAFDAAGFIDAFRVEAMPEGVDPLDLRYNIVSWLNRSTRGYAYGQSVVDPRTGEVLKGAVNLDSQRGRQDLLVFESLLGVDGEGKGGPNDPIQVALSRVRQLSAHEIGHTLGFQHNFASSTNDRSSVMDYPAPLIDVKGGKLDLSRAYAPGVGAWDEQTIRYAYTQFPSPEDEKAGLEAILKDSIKRGLLFLSDADAEESDGAEPRANRWDNGTDPVAGLNHALQVRSIAMQAFGIRNLHSDRAVASLEATFGPLYFFHRYDVDAAAKMVGGLNFVHAVKGDRQMPQKPVPGIRQRQALAALLACLSPSVLNVPVRISRLMGPPPNGGFGSSELFAKHAAFVFDTLAASQSAGDLVVSRLLNPARCARILELSLRDPSLPTLDEVIAKMSSAIVRYPTGSPMDREISWGIQRLYVTRLIDLAASGTSSGVLARSQKALADIAATERQLMKVDSQGHAALLAQEIDRFLTHPLPDPRHPILPSPALPGAPIGNWSQGELQ